MLSVFVLAAALQQSPQQRAIATVDAAVTAMGGTQKLRSIKRLQRELAGVQPNVAQGPAPHVPDDAPLQEILARDGNSRIADVLDLTVRGGLRLHLRSSADPQKNFSVNYQNNTVTHFPAARSVPYVQAVIRRFPEQLLLNALRRPEALRWAGQQKLAGQTYEVVTYGDIDGEVDDLLFDPRSHELRGVRRLFDDPVRGDAAITTLYMDYADEQGFRFPTRVVVLQGSDTTSKTVVRKLLLNEAVADSLFVEPAGVPSTPSANPEPSLVPLGADAYLVKGSYNSAFVVFDDYVLVIEAPLSSGFQEAVINLIHGVAGEKPIRYVIATHFHYDHLGGLRPYIARGATVVTTGAARAVILEMVKAPHTLRLDTLSKAPRAPRVEVVTERRTFADAHHTVEIVPLQGMPHVPEILMAYLPAVKTLFQGDLYDSYALEEVPATDDGEKLLAWIDAAKVDVAQIIPVHGPSAPVPVSALRRAHELRQKR